VRLKLLMMLELKLLPLLLLGADLAHSVDLERVHVTGCSIGALMAYDAASFLAGRVASIVPVVGQPLLGTYGSLCSRSRVVCIPEVVPPAAAHPTATQVSPWRRSRPWR